MYIYIGQSIPKYAINKTIFLKQLIKITKLNEYELSFIINCDETWISFDSPLFYSLSKVG